jgi:3-phosphoshikimate 1-carboxyvinyltransferase
MTLAVVALFADGPSTLRNIGSWRVKETDRIAAMASCANWAPRQRRASTVAHHPAFDLARGDSRHLRRSPDGDVPCACGGGGKSGHIRDPRCVSNTFPGFFDRLAELVSRRRAPARAS